MRKSNRNRSQPPATNCPNLHQLARLAPSCTQKIFYFSPGSHRASCPNSDLSLTHNPNLNLSLNLNTSLRAGDLRPLGVAERNPPKAEARSGPSERARASHWAGARCPRAGPHHNLTHNPNLNLPRLTLTLRFGLILPCSVLFCALQRYFFHPPPSLVAHACQLGTFQANLLLLDFLAQGGEAAVGWVEAFGEVGARKLGNPGCAPRAWPKAPPIKAPGRR